VRRIERSGGLAYGRADGPQLDILPIPPTRPADPLRVLRDHLRTAPLTWLFGSDIPRALRPQADWSGLMAADAAISLRLLYPPKLSVLDALRDIEDHEFAQGALLPVEVITALLIADLGRRRQIDQNRLAVAAQAGAIVAAKWEHAATDYLPPALSNKQIETLALIASEDQKHWPLTLRLRGSDVARIVLALSRELWQPKRMIVPPVATGDEIQAMVSQSTLAAIDLFLRPAPTIEVAGVALKIDDPESILTCWAQTVEMLSCHITPEVVRALLPAGRFPVRGLNAYRDLPLDAEQRDVLNGLWPSLVREAEAQAAYAPTGTFRLELPAELTTLRAAGVDSLTVCADGDGLWVRALGREEGGVFRWDKLRGLQRLIVPQNYAAWLNVVLAALWHDLRVTGDESVPLRESAPQRNAGERGAALPDTLSKSPSTRMLPVLRLSGKRQWSTPVERAYVARQAHGVRGFRRRLHEGWSRSEEAAQIARDYGVVLPDGYTFVRPHVRGVGEIAAETPTEVVTVRARGLASVIALLE